MQYECLSSASEVQTFALPAPSASIIEAGPEAAVPVERNVKDKQVAQAIRRLWCYCAVREPALRVLSGSGPVTLYPFLDALKRPLSMNWREAQVAVWALGHAPLSPEQKTEAISALTRVLHLSVSRSPLQKLRLTKCALAATTFVGLLIGGLALFSDESGEMTRGQLLCLAVLVTIVCNVVLACFALPIPYLLDCLYENRRWQVRASTIKALGQLTGSESLDLLISVLKDPAQAVRNEAVNALLPLLTPVHRGQLRPQAISAICMDIEYKTEAEVLNRLDALEMIGDTGALKTLKHMQHYGRTKAMCVRAAQVYSVLEERQAQENAPKMLLRASNASHVAPDVLLRAASADDVADPTQLLRASASEHLNQNT